MPKAENKVSNQDADQDLERIREFIQSEIDRQGISLRKLARLSGLNLCTVQRLFNEDGTPTLYSFVRICLALNIVISINPIKQDT